MVSGNRKRRVGGNPKSQIAKSEFSARACHAIVFRDGSNDTKNDDEQRDTAAAAEQVLRLAAEKGYITEGQAEATLVEVRERLQKAGLYDLSDASLELVIPDHLLQDDTLARLARELGLSGRGLVTPRPVRLGCWRRFRAARRRSVRGLPSSGLGSVRVYRLYRPRRDGRRLQGARPSSRPIRGPQVSPSRRPRPGPAVSSRGQGPGQGGARKSCARSTRSVTPWATPTSPCSTSPAARSRRSGTSSISARRWRSWSMWPMRSTPPTRPVSSTATSNRPISWSIARRKAPGIPTSWISESRARSTPRTSSQSPGWSSAPPPFARRNRCAGKFPSSTGGRTSMGSAPPSIGFSPVSPPMPAPTRKWWRASPSATPCLPTVSSRRYPWISRRSFSSAWRKNRKGAIRPLARYRRTSAVSSTASPSQRVERVSSTSSTRESANTRGWLQRRSSSPCYSRPSALSAYEPICGPGVRRRLRSP